MADPFGIIGVIGVAGQIIQMGIQFGLNWKDAPADVKSFMAELQVLKTTLSETNTNIALNQDFINAFKGRHSTVLSQLTDVTPATDTSVMVSACRTELEHLLAELKKRAQAHRVGWERMKGAFLAKKTREAVESLQRQCQFLNNLVVIDIAALQATTLKEVREGTMKQQAREAADEQDAILRWLTPVDYAPQQSDFINRRQVGTGQWLLESREFQVWLQTDKQTLFCHGMPGAGKTILTSIVVDELMARFGNDMGTGIAYIYCNFRRQDGQKAEDLFASLLKQLAQGRSSLPDSVKSLHDKYKTKRTRPPFADISVALQSLAAEYSRAFIIVDALDECRASDGCRTKFLSELFSLQVKCGVNILTTSRSIPEIYEQFDKSTSLEVRATDEDVRTYLDGHISQLPAFVRNRSDLQEEITTGILKAVSGMFLLAQLHFDSLKGKRSPKVIRGALKNLATGSDAYDRAYNDAMERIEAPSCKVLPRGDDVDLKNSGLRTPLSLAAEYGHEAVVKVLLEKGADIESKSTSGLIALWSAAENRYGAVFKAIVEKGAKVKFTNIFGEAPLSLVVQYRHEAVVKLLLEEDADIKPKSIFGRIPLSLAATNGHEAVVKVFLEKGSDIESKDNDGGTPLSLAAEHGRNTVVKVLLEKGADIESKDKEGRTPLSWSVIGGHEAVVKMLLERGTDVESKDNDGRTPLSLAAEYGHEAVIKLLLGKGADIESKDNEGRTPLSWTVISGRETAFRVLQEKGTDINSKGSKGWMQLSLAAARRHAAVVQLLLDRGADVNSKDKDGQTPLSWAAQSGHEAIVKQLQTKA
ncbi:hypothetical protein DL767_003865 [Monosporascus sp. MG133]|nr:hypothetical protein DL767_003865 [Monosporascus sp. MG133]